MGKIFVGQTMLEISLLTHKKLESVASAKIMYRKPDGQEGEFDAAVVVPLTTKGEIKYTVQNISDIDQSGDWTLWAKITYDNSEVIFGECSCLTVHQPGQCSN